MEGLTNAVVSTPGVTFTYAPADIQGLADTSQPVRPNLGASPSSLQIGPSRGGLQVTPCNVIETIIQQQQDQSPAASSPISPTAKDHQRIRGRMTPYAFFVQQRRDLYRQQNVPVQFTPFSKECSSLWKAMTDEEKQKFQKLAEEDRDRYQREMTGFMKPLAKDGTRRGRKKKEPGQPKRNMCAFLHFCSEKRPKLKQENPNLSVGAMARQLSLAWKLMTSEQKKPYDEMADRDKQRYEQQKQAYEAGYSAAFLRRDLPPGMQQQPSMMGHMMSVSPRHRRRKKDPDMPRRNMSAFMFYSLDKRPGVKAKNPEFGVGKLAQRLAENWRVMSPPERNPYESLARQDKERYEVELKAYKRGTFKGSSSISAAHVHTAMRQMQEASAAESESVQEAELSKEVDLSQEEQSSSESEKVMKLDTESEKVMKLDTEHLSQEEEEEEREISPSDEEKEDGEDMEEREEEGEEREEVEEGEGGEEEKEEVRNGRNSQENELEELCELYQ